MRLDRKMNQRQKGPQQQSYLMEKVAEAVAVDQGNTGLIREA